MDWKKYQLRKMNDEDLADVLSWRNSRRIRKFMYTDHIISEREHLDWFAKVTKDTERDALIFEMNHHRSGVINLRRMDPQTWRWGFYLGDTELPRGTGLVMGILVLEYVFEKLKAQKLQGEVFAFNKVSLSYHKRLGFSENGIKKKFKNHREEAVILFEYNRSCWRGKEHCKIEEP